jgi:hypothetical protein
MPPLKGDHDLPFPSARLAAVGIKAGYAADRSIRAAPGNTNPVLSVVETTIDTTPGDNAV